MDAKLVFGVGLSAVTLFIRWRFPTVARPIATAGVVVGIGLIAASQLDWLRSIYGVAAIAALSLLSAFVDWKLMPSKEPQTPSPPMTSIDQSVTSFGQSGGITAHTVYSRPAPRSLHDEDTREIVEALKGVPRGPRSQVLFAAGDFEAQALATEVRDYMVSNGYNVSGVLGEAAGLMVRGFKIMPDEDRWHIYIGASPR